MRGLWLIGMFAGCAPPTSDFVAVTTGTSMSDTGATAPVATSTTDAAITTSTDTTAVSTTTIDTTASSSGAHFIVVPDSEGPPGGQCDVYAQDCPPGQKCAWTAPEGDQYWENTTCVPLAQDPLPEGAPCTYDLDAVFDGVDDCSPGTMCVEAYFELGEWDGKSTCQPLCKGSSEYPYCDPGMVCVGGRALYLCVPTCDPLVQDCAVGLRCDLYGAATLCQWDWPEEPRVSVGEPCSISEECELGATCMPAATPSCIDSTCCTPFCDLGDPQAKCPLLGQQCLDPYGWGQPVQASLGVCRVEAP